MFKYVPDNLEIALVQRFGRGIAYLLLVALHILAFIVGVPVWSILTIFIGWVIVAIFVPHAPNNLTYIAFFSIGISAELLLLYVVSLVYDRWKEFAQAVPTQKRKSHED